MVTDQIQHIEISKRYQVRGEIGKGAMGIVYHAHDRLVGQDVALKLVTASSQNFDIANSASPHEMNTQSFRLALAQEFKTLATLRHPNIISVLDYGFTPNKQPYFTMQLLESPRHIDVAATALSTDERVSLVIDILQALAYLHRRDILHRDLKPANVLVDQDNRVYVLDFGLAYSTDNTGRGEESENIAGTLTYMAPETLKGSPPTTATDLYAVGVIAYQIFTGDLPYQSDNTVALINDIMFSTPTFEMIPEHIELIISRLLSKEPELRYSSADNVIDELLNAMDRDYIRHTGEIRESYLQAAAFVGRDDELRQLIQGVKGTLRGKGSAWLIAGESGVGKSRLLNELRTQALIEGALVVRGQAISEGGASYILWRDVMRWLMLLLDDPDEEASSVAKSLVPDLERILGHTVADIPALNPQQERERLLIVFERLLRQVKRPLVILLEDLQWTRESLDVLKHVNQFISELPVMTIGTYRNDERPRLAEQVIHNQLITLKRLDSKEIAELSRRILGNTADKSDLVALIEKQTEGNAFFIIEVIRALAEDVDSFDEITQRTLPPEVFSGGMQRIIARRLNQVPEDAQKLLRYAAIIGRQIDKKLLNALAPSVTSLGLDAWFLACADAAVLDIDEDIWRFSHDKLRSAVLDQITDSESPTFHKQVAETTEKVYPDDPTMVARLMVHWREAGDEEKERAYTWRVADQMYKAFAMDEAIRLYQRVLALSEPGTQDHIQLLLKLSDAYSLTDFTEAKPLIEQAIQSATELNDHRHLAEAYSQLGRMAMLRDGDWDASEAHLQKALSAIRKTDDRAVLSSVLRHCGNLAIYISDFDKSIPYLEESIEHAQAISNTFLEGMAVNSLSDAYAKRNKDKDHDLAIDLSIKTRDIGRNLGHRRLVMMGIAHIGLVALHREDYKLAYEQFVEAYDITKEIHDYEQLGKVANYVGICTLGLKRYDEAQDIFLEGIQLSLDNQSLPEVIRGLTGIALIWQAKSNHTDALALMHLTLNDARCSNETKVLANATYESLQKDLSASEVETAKEKGEALIPEDVAHYLLSHPKELALPEA